MKYFVAKVACRILLLGTFLVISACSVRMKQIDTVRRLLPSGSDTQALMSYAWTLTFNGTELVIFPVEAQGRQVLFASKNGLRLRWDGESIIVIEGLPGAFGRYESGIEQDGKERWYAQEGRTVERARCAPRREWRLSDRQHGWRQDCLTNDRGQLLRSYHAVEFDVDNNIKLIEASSRPGGSLLSLSRSN